MSESLFLENAPVVWMIAGALFIVLEAFMIPGIGFLFAGLGAITVGLITATGLVQFDHLIPQMAWFFAATTFWAVVLWKPLKRFRIGKNESYKNIIGDQAIVVGKPLEAGKTGEVKWSGTTMSARIVDGDISTAIPVGNEVEIVKLSGNLLLVKTIH